ncbi:MAG: hypothetical protein QXP36_04825 [Conexivisphaerales archaeon]
MAEPVTQTPAQGANEKEQTIQLILKKLAYIAIQFQNIDKDEIFADYLSAKTKEQAHNAWEEFWTIDEVPRMVWKARRDVIKLIDPDSTKRQRDYAEGNLEILLEIIPSFITRKIEQCINDKRKERYLKLLDEFNKVKEMIEKTVLS